MFYIKQLTMTGEKVAESNIDFEPGLNIIHGPSNCGKSYIVECLDYMFGAERSRIDNTLGYDTIKLLVSTDSGDIYMERKLDSKDVKVVSNNSSIESGNYKAKSKKKGISLIWLKLMGIDEPVEIIKSAALKHQQLTIRVFLHTFLINESQVLKEKSILLPEQKTNETALKSALLYLINGKNYLPEEIVEDPTLREEKKKAVAKYIEEQLKFIREQKEELNKKASIEPKEIQVKINAILTEIDEAEGEISLLVLKSRELATKILNINDQLAESANLQQKYQVLQTQYASDVRRLTFIAEGELISNEFATNTKCPFCNGKLLKREEASYVEAAKTEINRLLPQINDLKEAETSIQKEKLDLEKDRDFLIEERQKIENKIKYDLRPRISNLRENLAQYTFAVEDAKEASILLAFESRFQGGLDDLEDDDEQTELYNVNSKFDGVFREKLKNVLTELLISCKFDGFENVFFDLSSFDVVVNDKKKETYGKGFRAFLNVILALAMQEYLERYGKYNSHMLIVDSPILSIKERGTERVSDSMKYSLFKYLMEHQNSRQTIIIENDIPEMDYSNAKLIEFTRTETGRYGFLADVK